MGTIELEVQSSRQWVQAGSPSPKRSNRDNSENRTASRQAVVCLIDTRWPVFHLLPSRRSHEKQRSPPNSLPSWNTSFWRACSGQLLNQDGEHAFDRDSLLRQRLVIAGLKQSQIPRQQVFIFQFAGRTSRDDAKASQFGVSVPTASFGDIRRD